MELARLLYIDAMVFVTLAMPTLLVAMAVITRPAKAKSASPVKAEGSVTQLGWRGSHSRTPAQSAARAT